MFFSFFLHSCIPTETHGKLDNYLIMLQFVPYLAKIDLVHKRCIRQCEQQSVVSMPALFAEINLS